jgi:hypothetical protein
MGRRAIKPVAATSARLCIVETPLFYSQRSLQPMGRGRKDAKEARLVRNRFSGLREAGGLVYLGLQPLKGFAKAAGGA